MSRRSRLTSILCFGALPVLRWAYLWYYFSLLMALVLVLYRPFLSFLRPILVWLEAPFVFPVLLIGSPVVGWVHESMIRRRAAKVGYFMCTDCGFELNGLPESGRCPECGELYSKPELEIEWKRGRRGTHGRTTPGTDRDEP